MKTDRFKKYVIKRRTSGNERIGNLLAKAIEAFEKSRITSDYLTKYYNQLQVMEK